MNFRELSVPGAMLIDIEPAVDERGLFARVFCAREFSRRGLPANFVQHSTSFNTKRGTLRGLHYQRKPFEEAKLVRCVRGKAFDVVVDLRRDSPAFGKWCAVELSEDNRTSIFVPRGCAHGFQALSGGTELLYQIDTEYAPEAAAGVHWDDPTLAIPWPISDPVVSARDRALASLSDLRQEDEHWNDRCT